ncbi:hypothetical protein CFR75_11540 [Komagataeibacter xylinus]|uniref:Uncharacterized protein n=1 Tax=Komagataeibacter xylinus TaxID=28448 RepID=A0A318PL93_KOMXY|nr:hypothetical protein CXP35_09175 [Komagataeibacter xylinus]PYD56342.1 hypothetical protein CFR75_11540 [Komagataeibacter xylinus]
MERQVAGGALRRNVIIWPDVHGAPSWLLFSERRRLPKPFEKSFAKNFHQFFHHGFIFRQCRATPCKAGGNTPAMRYPAPAARPAAGAQVGFQNSF